MNKQKFITFAILISLAIVAGPGVAYGSVAIPPARAPSGFEGPSAPIEHTADTVPLPGYLPSDWWATVQEAIRQSEHRGSPMTGTGPLKGTSPLLTGIGRPVFIPRVWPGEGDALPRRLGAHLAAWGGDEKAKLTASDGATYDSFGFSVAISGDTVVIGAYGDDDAGDYSGSAYVFERNQGGPGNWGQVVKLTASDAGAGDRFGSAVAIDGDTVVVGATEGTGGGTKWGVAYVFERNQGGPDNWGQVKKLIASDGGGWDSFGYSVSISGDTIVVGAPGEDEVDMQAGAAYVFQRDEGGADNWGQVKKLTASDGAAGDNFGYSVDISTDTVLVGTPHEAPEGFTGWAYVFERDEGGTDNWGQVKKLVASDGAADDLFGYRVTIDGDTAVVGALGNDGVGSNAGAAYVFEQDEGGPGNWGQVKKLTASDGGYGDRFGYPALDSDTLVVGAPHDTPAGFDSGSAYVFDRNEGGADNWGETEKLTASDGAASDQFGGSASINGNTVVVGALGKDNYTGAAYVYEPEVPLDLAITKAVTPSVAAPGDAITYTLAFWNAGTGLATGVVITDIVPLTITVSSVLSSGVAITDTGASPAYVWDVADLAQGEGGMITITGIISPSVGGVFTLTNQATITTTEPYTADGNLANNVAVVYSTVDGDPPIAPTLVSPTDGAIISDTTPTLIWQASPSLDVAGYLLDFDGTVMDVGYVTQYTTSLLADGIYTWTVAAYDVVRNTSPYTDVWSFTVEETITDEPIAGLSALNDSPTPLGQATTLTATITAGSNVTYTWAFGDGATGNGAVVPHTYPDVGVYTAVVTASNSISVVTATTTVTVDETIAGLAATNDSPTPLGQATTLTVTITAGSNVTYTWAFGDGVTGNGAVVPHTYPDVGVYTAVVTASNSVSELSATTTVTIYQPARTCWVRLNDDPTDYLTAQAAVDASTQPTDLVKVAGTCTGVNNYGDLAQQVYLDKTLTIRGGYSTDFSMWDPDTYPTTLDAQDLGRVFYVTGDISPTLEALRITGGDATGLGGGGQSDADAGGGFYVIQAQPTIRGCQIYGGAAYLGGGVYLHDSTDATLADNAIFSNTAAYGSGVYVFCGEAVTLTGNQIYSNTGPGRGGGVFFYTSQNGMLSGNRVYDNMAADGGGVCLEDSDGARFMGNWIRENTADWTGGGVYLIRSDASFVNDMVLDNRANTWVAGIVALDADAHLSHMTIARNQGTSNPSWGQGVSLGTGALWMTNTIVVSHTVGIVVGEGSTAALESTLWGAGPWANDQDWGGLGVVTSTHNYTGTPAFVDPDGGDYHIDFGSAAINRGVDAGVTTDVDGEPRPVGLGYDLGADELTPDEPIAGLEATNDSPTLQGQATTLTATVTAGINVTYQWAFGDGATGSGAVVIHTYPAAGNYTAVVSATDSVSVISATTPVTIYDIADITPGGGPITTTDEVLTLEAPPGLTSTLTFTYTPVMSPSQSTGDMKLAGIYFNLSACDEAGDPVHTFSSPLTLTVHYDEWLLSPDVNEEDLLLYRWDEAAGEWQALTVLERDTDANTITVALDHLTEFALLGLAERRIYLPLILRNFP